jgi:two-component system response regulator FixJ
MPKKRKKIFIVDDDESVCRSLTILLDTYGYAVDTFIRAEDFFRALKNNAPGCLILDIHMPGIDGWEVLSRINTNKAKFPVIVISADKHEVSYERAIKLGAYGFLHKPFTGCELADMIQGAMKKRHDSGQKDSGENKKEEKH